MADLIKWTLNPNNQQQILLQQQHSTFINHYAANCSNNTISIHQNNSTTTATALADNGSSTMLKDQDYYHHHDQHLQQQQQLTAIAANPNYRNSINSYNSNDNENRANSSTYSDNNRVNIEVNWGNNKINQQQSNDNYDNYAAAEQQILANGQLINVKPAAQNSSSGTTATYSNTAMSPDSGASNSTNNSYGHIYGNINSNNNNNINSSSNNNSSNYVNNWQKQRMQMELQSISALQQSRPKNGWLFKGMQPGRDQMPKVASGLINSGLSAKNLNNNSNNNGSADEDQRSNSKKRVSSEEDAEKDVETANVKQNKKCVQSGSSNNNSCNKTIPRCQVDGCTEDLSKAKKDYHRRHRVCEMHSKAPKVVTSGVEQRFCQQCSRFHVISEFDDSKRSCRRRLAGHNERRRKSSQDIAISQQLSLVAALQDHSKLHSFQPHIYNNLHIQNQLQALPLATVAAYNQQHQELDNEATIAACQARIAGLAAAGIGIRPEYSAPGRLLSILHAYKKSEEANAAASASNSNMGDVLTLCSNININNINNNTTTTNNPNINNNNNTSSEIASTILTPSSNNNVVVASAQNDPQGALSLLSTALSHGNMQRAAEHYRDQLNAMHHHQTQFAQKNLALSIGTTDAHVNHQDQYTMVNAITNNNNNASSSSSCSNGAAAATTQALLYNSLGHEHDDSEPGTIPQNRMQQHYAYNYMAGHDRFSITNSGIHVGNVQSHV